jgi:hypothetical protein
MYREALGGLFGAGVIGVFYLGGKLIEYNSWDERIRRLIKSPQVEMLGKMHSQTTEILEPGYADTVKAGIYREIDWILFFIWDPIGINDDGGDPWVESNPDELPRDEYYSYVPLVYDFLRTNPDRDKIKVFLENMMAQYMIKPEARQREMCERAADKLAEMRVGKGA